jgi:FkbM family methyltransferase
MKKFYSEYGEDLVLFGIINRSAWLLKKPIDEFNNKTYIDIGCNDPINFSTTYFFYKNMNWSGIMVDPSYGIKEKVNIERPKDIFIQCAISNKDGEADLFVLGEESQINTIDINFLKKIKNLPKIKLEKTVKIKTITLDNLISQQKINEIFLMNIDTEGKDLEIVESYSWKIRPTFVTVENFDIASKGMDLKISQKMVSLGYREVARTYLTSIFLDNSSEIAKVI